MSLVLLVEIVLLVVALGGIFANYANANYAPVGRFVAAICVLLLFLIAVGVLRL